MAMSRKVRTWLTGLRFALKSVLGRSPTVYFGIQRLRRSRRHLLVKKDTEIVIEGYPRSANTFAVVAFLLAQGRPVKIAHHLHVPAQVIQAGRWGIPTIVLIRDPQDAVLSLLVREPYLSARRALQDYIIFYSTISHYRNSFVVAPFDEVINNFGQVIVRANERFGTIFKPFEPTDENIRKVFALVEEMHKAYHKRDSVIETKVARPSAVREALKLKRMPELARPEAEELLKEAYQVYEMVLRWVHEDTFST
jgi:hypothetical protein